MSQTLFDLTHTIENGTVTYKGLPALRVCDFLSRDASKSAYDDQATFQIDEICMVGNTGTYMDSPFHRYQDGEDLSQLALAKTVNLPVLVVWPMVEDSAWFPITVEAVKALNVPIKGKAVLFATGWSRYFNTEKYQSQHPFLTQDCAEYLRDNGAVLIGVDSHNIDDTRGRVRPVHNILLRAGIPIVEHMTGLIDLPRDVFQGGNEGNARFFAAPVKFKGVGTMSVRAFILMAA